MSDDGIADGELSEEEANALLDRLGLAIADTEAVPPWLTRFANESHRLVSFEGELAEIVADSFVDEPVGMRSGSDTRNVSYAVDLDGQQVTITLEIEGANVRGAVAPADATIAAITESERNVLSTNERGFFTFVAPEGLFRFAIDVSGVAVRTDWIKLR